MPLPPHLKEHPEGTVVSLFVQPRARRDALGGIQGDALKVKVKAPPLDGKANAAAARLLAEALGVAVPDVVLMGGAGSRNKRMLVRGKTPKAVASELGSVLSSRAHDSS